MSDILAQTKTCLNCGEEKELSTKYFSKYKKTKDGFNTWCKICDNARNKEWYVSNPEKARAKWERWTETRRRRTGSKRRIPKLVVPRKPGQTARQRKNEWDRLWKKNNPAMVRARKRNRRALLKKVGGKITAQEWEDLLEKHEHKCLRCGTMEDITLDHVKPLDMQGPNVIENAQPLCRSCNAWKKNRWIDFRV